MSNAASLLRGKAALCLTLLAISSDAGGADPAPLRGYTPEHAAAEVRWEQKFRELPDPARLRENMRRLSARPHHVGSPYDKDNAEWLLAQLKSYGLDAKIEVFETLFPTPKFRKLELLGRNRFEARLEEPALKIDPTSSQKHEQLPTYNAYSRDGDVTAPLVYVNFGAPEDYEQLDAMGVSVKGAIVIARYGQNWRGIKPKIAAERGAVGCIIYSDPQQDGYGVGEPFPAGPMRPEQGAQRGSVMDLPLYPGDPQTPGIGAVAGARLLPLDQVETITKIPVLPISYDDAKPFLTALGGEVVPENWRGALPFTYRTGPSMARAHLAVASNWDRKPLYDVIATIPGSEFPDEWVIRGNHHDAWVNGAADPVSAASPLLEEARGLGELLKQGWRPRRTILICFWDGEEAGMLGSTEWAETHADELQRKAVAYFNTDGNGRGFWHADGSHSLENFANSVARDVEDPETKLSAWERAHRAEIAHAAPEARADLRARADLHLPALGAGSDYSTFVNHLGIPSVNFGFSGEDATGQYHSIYDDFYMYTHYQDPGFVYGRALAQTAGSMSMRMADADVLPFRFVNLAETVQGYAGELKKLAETLRAAIKERNTEIADGVYEALRDPKKPVPVPPVEAVPPYFNFAALEQATDDLTAAAASYEKAFTANAAHSRPALNAALLQAERAFLDSAGLPRRPWYRHMLYGPGYYTGYSVKTLPAVREALEEKRWKDVDAGIARTAAAIEREVALLKSATQILEAGR